MKTKTAALLGAAFLMTAQMAIADTIRLSNGDTMTGKVTTFNENEVVIKSEVLGELRIPREKVVAIVLGDLAIPGKSPAATPPAAAGKDVPRDAAGKPNFKGKSPQQIIDEMTNKNFDQKAVRVLEGGRPAPPNQADVLKQLRETGIPRGLTDELTAKLPGFGTPEVQGYFNSKVNGLIDGSISIQDIRKDAIKARDQIKDLQKDLGPSAGALNGYLGILEGFINETTPPEETQPASPQPPSK
ncbi:MAG: hypothetical protein NXI22_22200 [bacterium]|nr:hypothetical protein [bacterium]